MDEHETYWVFVDRPVKKAKLHLASCGACKSGQGMHGHQESQCWWKSFPTRTDAWDYASREARKMGVTPSTCGLCKP